MRFRYSQGKINVETLSGVHHKACLPAMYGRLGPYREHNMTFAMDRTFFEEKNSTHDAFIIWSWPSSFLFRWWCKRLRMKLFYSRQA